MNITVAKEDIANYQDVHGGGYSVDTLHIVIDKNLDQIVQRNMVINEVIEAFCRTWHKDTVDELVELMVDALNQLDNLAT